MSAGNRKNPSRPSVTDVPPLKKNTQYIYILVLVAVAGVLAGLVLFGGSAKASNDQVIDHLYGEIAELNDQLKQTSRKLDDKHAEVYCLEKKVKELKRELRMVKRSNGASTVVLAAPTRCKR